MSRADYERGWRDAIAATWRVCTVCTEHGPITLAMLDRGGAPLAPHCSAVRWHLARCGGDSRYPCVRGVGHDGAHVDSDGDSWE